jgi:oligopeptide/dipeptide ABC transporter ATP-binding protein
MENVEHLLEIKNLSVAFKISDEFRYAVKDCSFVVKKGKTIGLVGESGSGKSVTSLSIMRLLAGEPTTTQVKGTLLFEGINLLTLKEKEMEKIRGRKISMIFQEPMTSLNPVMKIGKQISEVFELHYGLSSKEAKNKAIEMLHKVKIPMPEKRFEEYPHELSGGMRQRIMIAMALACNPELLIADEPTTALDVTVQAQIIALLNNLQKELGMSMLLITHDLGVVSEMCDEVAIMYAGKIVEQGTIHDIFTNPKHPYTQGLLKATLVLGHKKPLEELSTIPGHAPLLTEKLKGCHFHPRCPKASKECQEQEPLFHTISPTQKAACFKI